MNHKRGARTVAVRNKSKTGGKLAVIESLKRSVAAIARPDRNVKGLYIGIASGSEADRAARRRIDEFKISKGINEIIVLYTSTSEINTRHVEAQLVEWFETHIRSVNRVGGGGGRPSRGPRYFVYVAVRRWG